MILKLKDGDVKIELFEDVAPNHVNRIKELADSGKYDNVVFHRVIDGFMAQTGDVQFGNSSNDNFDIRRAGTGNSDLPDLKEEFSSVPHDRGTLSMARTSDPLWPLSHPIIVPTQYLPNTSDEVLSGVTSGFTIIGWPETKSSSKNAFI
mgnify:CR=1 FL=1